MNIKHLQLNTALLRDPEGVVSYLNDQEVDVACLQEIVYPIGELNKLEELVKAKGYNYAGGTHFNYLPKNETLGVAIVSKYPIVDIVRTIWNSPDYTPKNIDANSFLGNEIIYDHGDPNDFPGSRGVKHIVKSRCILMCLFDTPSGLIRVVTTHFTVSDLCTETSQMYEMACLTASLIDNAKNYPTIFSGDLNIRAQSYSVSRLSEVVTCHTTQFTDTLSKDHISKEKDFPEGLAIDHVFSKGMDLIDISASDVSFSEHKALLSNFNVM